MLILHVLPDLTIGGAEMMMKRLVESHLTDVRYSHVVVSLRGIGTIGAALQNMGIQVQALGMTSARQTPWVLRRLVGIMRETRPDIVQTWMYHSDLLGGLAARRAGIRRVIWGVRTTHINLGVARATLYVRRMCALLSSRIPGRIVYVAEAARRSHEALGYEASKSVTIPNGFPVEPNIERSGGAAAIRAELGLDPSNLLIGTAGRFNATKDFRTFVAACNVVANQHPSARFIAAGRDVSWDNTELADWIGATGHKNRFHLLGERRDLQRVLAGLDIFCLHSLIEGFPNVVGEAMAVGTPCVVTDVGDAALLVGDTGLVVQPANPPALANAIGMLASDPGRRNELGRRAHQRILEHFSIDVAQAKFEQLYESLMEGGEATGSN